MKKRKSDFHTKIHKTLFIKKFNFSIIKLTKRNQRVSRKRFCVWFLFVLF